MDKRIMKVIDFTHTITGDMPVFPGTDSPRLEYARSIKDDGYRETLLTLFSHTGTHMDAPAHLIDGGISLDLLDCSQFVGSAVVIDCTDIQKNNKIDISLINEYRLLAERADYLLFYTGWDRKWGTDDYFSNYPCISEEVADFITSTNIKGIGLDVISVDPVYDIELIIHKKLLSKNVVILENMCNLDLADKGLFTLIAAPLKFSNSDGAPVRVLGIFD